MSAGNINSFELLKQKIVATMQLTYPGINPDTAEWKSRELTDFQEELRLKVNAYVSEKWFYNHFKKKGQPLPRIDMLNLLSRYAGYLNWDDFLFRTEGQENPAIKIKSANRWFILLPLVVSGMVMLIFIVFQMVSNREYQFRFYDSLTKEPIQNDKIEIVLLSGKEPTVNYLSDSTGVCVLKTDKRDLKLLVSAPYYKTDTVRRIVRTFERNQKIGLQPDDFARMIHYFSEMKLEEWQKRREQLNSIIDEGAMICQVGSGSRRLGVELFTKQEFIDKLSIPAGSLKNLEILETRLRNDKIVILRFRIAERLK